MARPRPTLAFAFLLGAAALLPFLPALHADFVNWDDLQNLVANTAYRGWGISPLRWMFTSTHLGLYVPLSWLSFDLDHSLWGLDPHGFHLTNLLLHGANAALLFAVLSRLLSAAFPEPLPEKIRRWSAAAGALFFAWHPLRVESVAWVTERRDVLSLFFWLLALLAYLDAVSPEGSGRYGRRLAQSLGAFLLSLLAKGMGVTLPAVLLLLDFYPLRRWTRTSRKTLLGEKAAYLAVALPFAWLGRSIQWQSGTAVSWTDLTLGPRLAITVSALAHYLWKTLLPTGLSPLYELPLIVRWHGWPEAVSAALVLAITFLVIYERKRRPALLAAWLFFLITAAPVSGFFQNGPQRAADRYTYLPGLAFAALIAGATAVYARGSKNALRLAALWLAALAVLSWRQSRFWDDSITLWSRALAVEPDNTTAHNNLGNALIEAGAIPQAAAHFQSAMADPHFAEPRYNLANLYRSAGRSEEAERLYKEALQIDPRLVGARVNLGVVFFEQGRYPEAEQEFRRVIALRPELFDGHNNLGMVYLREGKPRLAVEEFSRALALQPTSPGALENLALAQAALR